MCKRLLPVTASAHIHAWRRLPAQQVQPDVRRAQFARQKGELRLDLRAEDILHERHAVDEGEGIAAADAKGKQAMLDELRARLLAEADAKIRKHDAREARRSERSLERLRYLESAASFNMLLRDSRSSSHIKVRSLPEATVVVQAAAIGQAPAKDKHT